MLLLSLIPYSLAIFKHVFLQNIHQKWKKFYRAEKQDFLIFLIFLKVLGKKNPQKNLPEPKPNPIANLILTPHGKLFSGEIFFWHLKMSAKSNKIEFSEEFMVTWKEGKNSSHRSCSVKKVFLEILQNSQENTYATASFLIKLQASRNF